VLFFTLQKKLSINVYKLQVHIIDELSNRSGSMTRTVWLGRKLINDILGLAHWAVKVDKTWYEIYVASKSRKINEIRKSFGKAAESGAGPFGGEPVGKTSKTDEEIESFNYRWSQTNPRYNVFFENCQKYAIEFIRWLTNNNYRLAHLPNSGYVVDYPVENKISVSENNHKFSHAHLFEKHESIGPLSNKLTFLSGDVEAAAAKSGVGAWVDASLLNVETKIGTASIHCGLNGNTGLGVRQGNLDVHLLGFGVKVGVDGVAVDTPVVGAQCSVM